MAFDRGKGGEFAKQLARAKDLIDPESGRPIAAAGKSSAGEQKRAQEKDLERQIKKRRKELKGDDSSPKPQHAPLKAKDPQNTANNSRAIQMAPPSIPVPEEKSSSKYLGGSNYRDAPDNTPILALGGAALAAYLFVNMKYLR